MTPAGDLRRMLGVIQAGQRGDIARGSFDSGHARGDGATGRLGGVQNSGLTMSPKKAKKPVRSPPTNQSACSARSTPVSTPAKSSPMATLARPRCAFRIAAPGPVSAGPQRLYVSTSIVTVDTAKPATAPAAICRRLPRSRNDAPARQTPMLAATAANLQMRTNLRRRVPESFAWARPGSETI